MTRHILLLALAFGGCSSEPPEVDPPEPTLRRLTQAQYGNALRDLLGEELIVSARPRARRRHRRPDRDRRQHHHDLASGRGAVRGRRLRRRGPGHGRRRLARGGGRLRSLAGRLRGGLPRPLRSPGLAPAGHRRGARGVDRHRRHRQHGARGPLGRRRVRRGWHADLAELPVPRGARRARSRPPGHPSLHGLGDGRAPVLPAVEHHSRRDPARRGCRRRADDHRGAAGSDRALARVTPGA